jgi:hypothetical protein
VRLGHEVVHRQQLDSRHPEVDQVLQRSRVGQPGVRAPQPRRDVGVAHREPAHVQLVDHGVRPRHPRPWLVAPVERLVGDDHRVRDEWRGVVVVTDQVVTQVRHFRPMVPEHRGVVAELAGDRARVRVEEQLGRVVSPPQRGLPRAVHAEAVALAWSHSGHGPVPHVEGDVAQRQPPLHTRLVEQAQLHGVGPAAPQGEVGRLGAPAGTQR